ncbi:major facilitator superfamily domain-containing protein [Myxozyma melibiosi]|uniref:Major facilitator superfamily domain-containing protein n=1 Tax=Myxozyma melibiosi TaxID=54550 RepID=A0ABR1F3A8_9ASCO
MVSYHEVPATKRGLQVACAFIWCLLAAGPIFGFAALKTVWLNEGVYADQCTPEQNAAGFICSTREIKLNFIFTCASVVTNIAGVVVGIILDRFGPRVCGYAGGSLIFIGALMLAFADTIALLDLYVWGYITLAFGGPFVFISSFQLSNAFPAYSGLVLALLTGAFDSSTAVYLVYRLIYDETGGKFHPKAFFLMYLIIPIFIVIASGMLMPEESYKPMSDIGKFLEEEEEEEAEYQLDASSIDGVAIDARTSGGIARADHKAALVSSTAAELAAEQIERIHNDSSPNHTNLSSDSNSATESEDPIGEDSRLLDESAALLSKTDRRNISPGQYEYDSEEMQKLKISGVWGALHGRSALAQIKTPWFILLCLFTMIQMLRLNYFVATIRSQYDFLFSSPEIARRITEVFDVALPVGGVLTVPIAGYILDHRSMATSIAILLVMGTTMGILGLFASYTAAYSGIGIFVIYRSFFYTTVSDYVAKVFGFDTFGQIYGLISTVSGLFNFGQSGFDTLTHHVLHRDPRPVNIGLVIVSTAIGAWFVWYVEKQARRIKRSALEFEAEQATALRMPGYAASFMSSIEY